MLFSTSNWSRRTVKALRKIFSEKGIPVEDEFFYSHWTKVESLKSAATEFGRKYSSGR